MCRRCLLALRNPYLDTTMRQFKIMFTNQRTAKPGLVGVRAQSHQHALDIAAVLGLEDAIVLFEIKTTIQQKETKP